MLVCNLFRFLADSLPPHPPSCRRMSSNMKKICIPSNSAKRSFASFEDAAPRCCLKLQFMSCIADVFAARNPRKRDRNSDTVATLCEVCYTVLLFDRVVVVSSAFWATTWKITPVGQFNYALRVRDRQGGRDRYGGRGRERK